MMIAMPDLDARRLVLRNNLAELDRLAGWIEGWAQQDLSPDLSFAVQLCLEEAVANIIMHSVANGRLEIAVEVERVRTKRWSPGSRITAAHSIRPRSRRHPFPLRLTRQRLAISASI